MLPHGLPHRQSIQGIIYVSFFNYEYMNFLATDIILTDSLEELASLLEGQENNVVLLYCTAGRMRIAISDVEHDMQTNDLLLCTHSAFVGNYMRTPDFQCVIICASARFFDNVAIECFRAEPLWMEKKAYLEAHPVMHLNDYQIQLMRSYAQLLRVYLEGLQDAYRQMIIQHLAKAATLEMLSYLDLVVKQPAPQAMGRFAYTKSDNLMLRFVELLRQSGARKHDVKWYAEQLRITPKYLSRVCKQRSGRTALDWIEEVTLEQIKHQLLRSNMTIKEVAFSMGFTNVSFFCQYVRSRTGHTPAELRKNVTYGHVKEA